MPSNAQTVRFDLNAEDNVSGVIRKVEGGLSGLSRVGGRMSKTLSSMASAGGVLAGALGLAAGGVAYEMKNMLSASMTLENSLIGLNSIATAFGQDAEKAKEAARSLSEDGLMSIADSASGLKNLLASGFSLDEATSMMNGFKDSAAFGRQGALAFGEAIVGATEGIKNGNSILVDNAGVTKNLSNILVEAGYSAQDLSKASEDVGVRQAILNGILKETAPMAGDAERSAGTLTGSLSKLKTTIFNASASLGGQFSPAVKRAVDSIATFVSSNQGTFVEVFNNIKQKIIEFSTTIMPYLQPAIDAFKQFFSEPQNRKDVLIATLTAIGVFLAAWAIKLAIVIAPIVAIFAGIVAVVMLVRKVWEENLFGIQEKTFAFLEWIKVKFEEFKVWWADTWVKITAFYNEYIAPLIPIIKTALEIIWNQWKLNFNLVKELFLFVVKTIWEAAKFFSKTLIDIFKVFSKIIQGDWEGAWNAMKEFVLNFFNNAVEWGKHFMQNLAKGIDAGWSYVKDAVEAIIDKVKDKLSFSYNPNLPSETWGAHFAENFGQGMKDGLSSVENGLNSIIGKASGLEPMSVGGAAAGGGGNGSHVYNFTFNGDINDKDRLIEEITNAIGRKSELSSYGIE